MIKLFFRSSLVLALAFCVGSCVGGGGGQPLQGAAVGQVMTNFAAVLTKLPRGGGTVTLPIAGATTSAVGDVNASAIDCETITPSPIEDVDADSIAKVKISTFNCSDLTAGGTQYTRRGTMTIRDLDETPVTGVGTYNGMSVEFALDELKALTIATSDELTETMNGFWRFLRDGNTLTSTAEFNGRYKFSAPAYARFKIDYGFRYTWDWAHTPDNPAAPWATGSEEFEGEYELDGSFVSEENGVHKQGLGKWVISYYSRNILYDNTCAKWFKSGSIFIEDGNGGTFEIRYACATAKFYINGKESDAYTP